MCLEHETAIGSVGTWKGGAGGEPASGPLGRCDYPAQFHCASRGLTSIKGLRQDIETFSVVVDGVAPLRCQHLHVSGSAQSFNVDAFTSLSGTRNRRGSAQLDGNVDSLLQNADLRYAEVSTETYFYGKRGLSTFAYLRHGLFCHVNRPFLPILTHTHTSALRA